MAFPRICIAGLRGGSGKTLVSLGIAAAWRKQTVRIAPFKKGPDYIDSAWLSVAAGQPCRNLDLYMMDEDRVVRSFCATGMQADVALVEGNRGLYDGMDAAGSYSTAELAIRLRTPVVLVVDCTKTTRTIAALVLGCQKLNPAVPIRGVVLNRTGTPRQAAVIREAVEGQCGVPVLGIIPRLSADRLFPERHLGLVPPEEHTEVPVSIDKTASVAEEFLDLDAIMEVARKAPALSAATPTVETCESFAVGEGAASIQTPTRIGIFRDAAFQFYYADNIEALQAAGGEVLEISPIRDPAVPDVDALYIGGGFPETLASKLSANSEFRESLKRKIEKGLPVYAECGGTVYLGEQLLVQGTEYPMVGVLPAVFGFGKKPQGHGYAELKTAAENPYFAVGDAFRGHEFHYTYVKAYGVDPQAPPSTVSRNPEQLTFAFRVRRGFGFDGKHDGLCIRNVLAMYTHVHALGVEQWAPSIVRAAMEYKER